MSSKKLKSVYDLGFHIIPTLEDSDALKVFNSVKSTIEKSSEILNVEEPKKIELEYTITHKVRDENGVYYRFDDAYFATVKFFCDKTFINELKQSLKENENIMRILVVETVRDETRAPQEFLVEEDAEVETNK